MEHAMKFPSNLHVGTSSWSSTDWCGTFYPENIAPSDMIRVYSSKLPTVENDSTWYRIPSRKMVEAWNTQTPDGFIFSAKVPSVISHEKYLVGCEEELNEFVSAMSVLGDKLGPLILQFPYVAKGKDPHEYETGADFLARLKQFLPLLSTELKWGIEIRNSKWIQPSLLEVLASRNISLAFIDYYTMDPLPKLSHRSDVFTSSFVYVRFLGNRKEMDAMVKRAQDSGQRPKAWGSLIKDCSKQMQTWIPPIKSLVAQGTPTYVYFNNHYAGYAPGSVELFTRLFQEEP
jgi:uncharacterized protein YecE (DUF72 family)